MKKALILSAVAAGLAILACNKTTTLPAYTQTIFFTANSKMSHASDTVKSSGDTLWLTASGTIKDTSRATAITATFRAADSATRTPLAMLYFKSLPVNFSNAAPDANGFYKWSSTVGLAVPAVATKSRFYSTATFIYGTYGSNQVGNTASTDSKTIFAK